jgi:3-deoxy-D-arabino-heptulosonate 7-phosphate (DAHP) synthase
MAKLTSGNKEVFLISRASDRYDVEKVIKAVAELHECSLDAAIDILLEHGCIKMSDSKIDALFKRRPEKAEQYWNSVKQDFGVEMNKNEYQNPFLALKNKDTSVEGEIINE